MIKLLQVNIDNNLLLNDIIRKKHRRNLERCVICGNKGTPTCGTCDNYDNRALLEAIKPYIFMRYDFYADNTADLNAIKEEHEITGHTKDLLIDSYDNSTDFKKARAKIYEGIPIAIRAKCPFCMISAPSTIDHYFDKDTYPEFAVYTPNLIPCCSECNTKKGKNMFLPTGERKILHYYFDSIPDYQFLVMSIQLEDNIPVVQISLNLDERKEVDRIIKNQFMTLELKRRYKEQLNDQLSNIVTEFKDYYLKGQDIQSLINMLNTRVRAYRRNNGMNYWLACLYDCLANNPNVLRKLLEAA